jgi:hypothetical protein
VIGAYLKQLSENVIRLIWSDSVMANDEGGVRLEIFAISKSVNISEIVS